jgi:hypothetical protein
MRSSKSVARKAQVAGTAAQARRRMPGRHAAVVARRLIRVTVAPAALEDRLNDMDSQTAAAPIPCSVGMSSRRLESQTSAAAKRIPIDAVQRISVTGGAVAPSRYHAEETH